MPHILKENEVLFNFETYKASGCAAEVLGSSTDLGKVISSLHASVTHLENGKYNMSFLSTHSVDFLGRDDVLLSTYITNHNKTTITAGVSMSQCGLITIKFIIDMLLIIPLYLFLFLKGISVSFLFMMF